MAVTCFSAMHQNRALWVKMNVFYNLKWWQMESNSMKNRHNAQSGRLSRTFNLLSQFVLGWQVHVSLPYSVIVHYEPNDVPLN
jgi:hypothetical protein